MDYILGGEKTPPGGSLRWRKDQLQWRPALDMVEK